jgi:trigger factor
MEDLKAQIKNHFNIAFEQHLTSIKKTEEEIKKSYRLEAEKRIKTSLILKEIGRKENIEVSEEELAEDLQKLMRDYTSEQLKKIDIEQLKEYSKGAIYNEKIFQFLENLSKIL